ncbi:phosphoesterase [Mesobacillus campisalis]|uniref:Phosphoesterase n=1 Tax=Mesobacillus campisalis TaxID=1408103 RepID=A0A0M2T170_9BACI|nr:IDEAL domain-containing protein [Mesobacillus campisalis]KKK39726.1 phosphoesterase [Mesobacillus campisalis]
MDEKTLYLPQPEGSIADSLVAEMVLEKALLKFRKEKIQQQIDQALSEKNKEEFMRLTEKLKTIS